LETVCGATKDSETMSRAAEMLYVLLLSTLAGAPAFQMYGNPLMTKSGGHLRSPLVSHQRTRGARSGGARGFTCSSVGEQAQVDPFDAVRAQMPKESYDLLVANVDPGSVDAMDLLRSSIKGKEQFGDALCGYERKEGGLRTVRCLTREECKALKDFIDEMTMRWHGPNARANVHWSTRIDSVDRCPDYQINLYPSDLARIVGAEGYKRIFNLPFALAAPQQTELLEPEHTGLKMGVFLRKYSVDTRPFIPFHVDTNSWTGNVAINADSEYEGGNLLVVTDGKVRAARREEGDATIHDNKIAHGVSSMVSGIRYSMILFFDQE